MSKRSRLPLALALALGSSSAFGLGLGQIEVKSALNQPLSADIPVLSSQSGETDALVVRLAPPEALERVGLPAPTGVAANLEFTVDTDERGRTVIRVTTPSKVNDPFVTFLLEVDWGQGKILREYTVLLDPPTMAPLRSTPVASAPVSEPLPEPIAEAPPPPALAEPAVEAEPAAVFEPVEPAEAPPPPELASEPAPTPEPTPEPVSEPAPSTLPPAPEPELATPTRTDTYGPVASGETLWSIAQYARPDESVSMNQMMLALLYANPDAFIDQNINKLKRGAILRIPTREETTVLAAAEAAARVREQMQTWRAEKAVMQPAEPAPSDSAAPRSVATRPETPTSRLELVPPRGDGAATSSQSGATAAGEGRELRAELARNQEQISTLNQENIELKSRVGELEKIQGDTQRLISLKDSELAAAQKRLAELEAQQQAAAATDASAPVDATSTDPAATAALPATDPASTDTTTATGEPIAATDPAAVTATDPAATSTEGPTPVVTSSETAPVAEAPAPEAEALPPPVAPTPWYMSPWLLGGGLLVVGGLLALLLGRRRSSAAAAPASRYGTPGAAGIAARAAAEDDSDEGGTDRESELAEAVARDPANLARHLELVRHHYDAGDAAGFEQSAEAMYSRVYDPDDLAWKQVVAMGREIAPEHPLFVDDQAFAPPAPEPVVTPAPSSVARDIDWSASSDHATTQAMKIDEVKAGYSTQSQPVLEVPPIETPISVESFSYEPPVIATPELEPTPLFVDADAASTKLELARAYLDMGDVDGARGMLEEVVSEGNPGQRAEAKRLLDEIR
jgi:pilus assembly protein FimV